MDVVDPRFAFDKPYRILRNQTTDPNVVKALGIYKTCLKQKAYGAEFLLFSNPKT